MDAPAREKKLRELRDELMHERGVTAMGGAPPNPGKIRALRKNIARIYTIQSEEGIASASRTAPSARQGTPVEAPAATAKNTAGGTEDDLEEDAS